MATEVISGEIVRGPPGPSWPNLADHLRRYVAKEFPEIVQSRWGSPGWEIGLENGMRWPKFHGLWITGSRIWRHMHNLPVDPESDWDIMVSNQDEMTKLQSILARLHAPKPTPEHKDKTSLGGDIFYTTRGRVDVWQNADVMKGLRNYPESHKHCRVAYNPVEHLVVMAPSEPHRDIDYGEELAQAERNMLYWSAEAERLKNTR